MLGQRRPSRCSNCVCTQRVFLHPRHPVLPRQERKKRQKRNSALHQSSRRFLCQRNRRHKPRSSYSKGSRDSTHPESVTYSGRVRSYELQYELKSTPSATSTPAGRTLISQSPNLTGRLPRPADPHHDVDSCPTRAWENDLTCSSESNAQRTTQQRCRRRKEDGRQAGTARGKSGQKASQSAQCKCGHGIVQQARFSFSVVVAKEKAYYHNVQGPRWEYLAQRATPELF